MMLCRSLPAHSSWSTPITCISWKMMQLASISSYSASRSSSLLPQVEVQVSPGYRPSISTVLAWSLLLSFVTSHTQQLLLLVKFSMNWQVPWAKLAQSMMWQLIIAPQMNLNLKFQAKFMAGQSQQMITFFFTARFSMKLLDLSTFRPSMLSSPWTCLNRLLWICRVCSSSWLASALFSRVSRQKTRKGPVTRIRVSSGFSRGQFRMSALFFFRCSRHSCFLLSERWYSGLREVTTITFSCLTCSMRLMMLGDMPWLNTIRRMFSLARTSNLRGLTCLIRSLNRLSSDLECDSEQPMPVEQTVLPCCSALATLTLNQDSSPQSMTLSISSRLILRARMRCSMECSPIFCDWLLSLISFRTRMLLLAKQPCRTSWLDCPTSKSIGCSGSMQCLIRLMPPKQSRLSSSTPMSASRPCTLFSVLRTKQPSPEPLPSLQKMRISPQPFLMMQSSERLYLALYYRSTRGNRLKMDSEWMRTMGTSALRGLPYLSTRQSWLVTMSQWTLIWNQLGLVRCSGCFSISSWAICTQQARQSCRAGSRISWYELRTGSQYLWQSSSLRMIRLSTGLMGRQYCATWMNRSHPGMLQGVNGLMRSQGITYFWIFVLVWNRMCPYCCLLCRQV